MRKLLFLNPKSIVINHDCTAQITAVVNITTNANKTEFVRINNDLPKEVAEAIYDTICQPTLGMATVLSVVVGKNPTQSITDTVLKQVSAFNTILVVLDENLTMITATKNWENLKKQLPTILENALIPFQNEPTFHQNNLFPKVTRRFFQTLEIVKGEILTGNFTDKYIAKKIGKLICLFNNTKITLDFITNCTTEQINEVITQMDSTLEAYQNVPEFQKVFTSGAMNPFNGYKTYKDVLIDSIQREKTLTTQVLEITAELMMRFYSIISTYNRKVAEVKWTVTATAKNTTV